MFQSDVLADLSEYIGGHGARPGATGQQLVLSIYLPWSDPHNFTILGLTLSSMEDKSNHRDQIQTLRLATYDGMCNVGSEMLSVFAIFLQQSICTFCTKIFAKILFIVKLLSFSHFSSIKV